MHFLKISTSLHTRLAVKTYLAGGELLQVTVNREEFLKLQVRTWIPVISKREGQHFEIQNS
jgi:hypothetical protein